MGFESNWGLPCRPQVYTAIHIHITHCTLSDWCDNHSAYFGFAYRVLCPKGYAQRNACFADPAKTQPPYDKTINVSIYAEVCQNSVVISSGS